MIVRSKLLRYIIERWKSNFTGTSALELAAHFSLPHAKVIKRLRTLASNNRIYLRETKLGQIEIRLDEDGRITSKVHDGVLVDTVIAFPARYILESVFRSERQDYGEFTNRLHMGDSQIKQYYFRQDVLDKYLRYQDRYNVYDTIVVGHVSAKDSYYSSLPESLRDNVLVSLRYGKRRLRDGGIAIAVIVIDLSNLSYQEQQYWASHELVGVQFAKEDYEYKQYVHMTFEGEWGEYEDPLEQIYNMVSNLNSITTKTVGGKLYSNMPEELHSGYIVINTIEAYQSAHKELYKVLGTDSLNKNVIIGLLKRVFGVKEDDLLKKDGKEKGTWELFKILVGGRMNIDFAPLQRCYDARISDTHKIVKRTLPDTDMTIKFIEDCKEILKTLRCIESYLQNT